MILSRRYHVLFYGCLLVWGIVDLARAVSGDTSWAILLLGVTYVAVAGYQLLSKPEPKAFVLEAQRAR